MAMCTTAHIAVTAATLALWLKQTQPYIMQGSLLVQHKSDELCFALESLQFSQLAASPPLFTVWGWSWPSLNWWHLALCWGQAFRKTSTYFFPSKMAHTCRLAVPNLFCTGPVLCKTLFYGLGGLDYVEVKYNYTMNNWHSKCLPYIQSTY